MRVVVIGASKGLGRAVAEEAAHRDHDVIGLARTPPDDAPGIAWRAGDARDPDALDGALAGADAVVTALGVKDVLRTTTLFSETARAVLGAMQRNDVRRLVAVTGFGAGDSRNRGGLFFDRVLMPVFAGRIYADKDREEAIIRASDRRWTIVRPGHLHDGPATGAVTALTGAERYRLGKVSRADVAAWILDRLEASDFVGMTPVLLNQ